MKIIPKKFLWLSISLAMVVPAVIGFLLFGFRLSADFSEGSLFAFRFLSTEKTVSSEDVKNTILTLESGVDLKVSSDGTFIMRLKRLSEEASEKLLSTIKKNHGDFELKVARDVSPFFAKTFRTRAINAVIVASVMILLYITFAFRKVSRGIASWKLGLSAVIALLHDVFIIIGIFVYLGVFFEIEIDALFITALLSVMGFSVHDTIVVFDRFRENLLKKEYQESLDDVAERSIQQTLARSINISVSAMLVLIPILVLGANEIFYFVLALALGIIVGTYSSIFVATPLLTLFQKNSSL